MQAVNVFMQAINAFMQAVNAYSRLPVLSNLLVWSGTFSTHCTAANRRDTVPIHYISLLVFHLLPYIILGSLPLANNGQHSASIN